MCGLYRRARLTWLRDTSKRILQPQTWLHDMNRGSKSKWQTHPKTNSSRQDSYRGGTQLSWVKSCSTRTRAMLQTGKEDIKTRLRLRLDVSNNPMVAIRFGGSETAIELSSMTSITVLVTRHHGIARRRKRARWPGHHGRPRMRVGSNPTDATGSGFSHSARPE